MTARVDWRGPYVLNGRTTATGSSKAWKNDRAMASAPIFEAEYGDWGWSGCSSSMGTRRAVP